MRKGLTSAYGILLCTALAGAQAKPSAAIPATSPTSSAPGVSSLPSAQPTTQARTEHGESSVRWTGAQLTVDGRGDSLRNILLQVREQTGMKVTGGIPDEPVFGSYGPASVQQVMAELFDGIAINMMLLNDTPTKPKELVLTARTGGVTPPMAQPINANEGNQFRNRQDGGNGGFGRRDNANQPPPPQQGPPPNAGTGAPTQGTPPDGTTPGTGVDANGQPQSPNGVRTPEQIFQDLQKRQQQLQNQLQNGGTNL